MAEKNIRIGRVSSIDYGNGMISVTYPDLDDSVTDDLPVFSMGDEYKMPPVGAEVLVLHLSNVPNGVYAAEYIRETVGETTVRNDIQVQTETAAGQSAAGVTDVENTTTVLNHLTTASEAKESSVNIALYGEVKETSTTVR